MKLIPGVSTLANLPRIVSERHGSKTALIIDDGSVSYDLLERRSNQVANALLQQERVEPGDRVAALGKASLESILLLFGAAKAKAVCLNINWRLSAGEITYILNDARPRVILVDGEYHALLSKILESLEFKPLIVTNSVGPHGWRSFEAWCGGAPGSPPGLDCGEEDVVALLYTSGTTGQPKGVQVANRSFFSLVRELQARGDPWIGWTDATVSMASQPMFHVAGLWWLVQGLGHGSTNIVLRSFDAATVLRLIPEHRVAKIALAPAMIQVLLAEPGCRKTDFSSLETFGYNGSPFPTAALKEAMAVFRCSFYNLYGLTETGGPVVCLRPEDATTDERLRATGKPLPGVELRILDPGRNDVKPGTVGEIALKSLSNMVGYRNRPEATREALIDGWLMTGDAGYRDEAGFLYVSDRIKDMIACAGEKVFSAEVESAIRTHPQVADVAVIGVPDQLWGEAVKAIVVPVAGANLRAGDIMRHVRGQLADFKVPKSVDFVEQLPRNSTGKVLKAKLREPYWEGYDRRI